MNAIAVFDKRISPIYGTVKFHQCDKKSQTTVLVDLAGFSDDKPKAMHIHTWGDLRNGCHSAGEHYNPKNKLHGNYILHGDSRHAGDLVNNIIPRDGRVNVIFSDNLISLFGKDNIIGRTIVIHSGEDDLGKNRKTDPQSATTGNAGGRAACSIIGLCKEVHF